MTEKEIKNAFCERLRAYDIPTDLNELDSRLVEYIAHVRDHSTPDAPDDVHNIDEVAACCRFLRMWSAYPHDTHTFTRFIRMYQNFLFSGLNGRTKYRMTPIQVFMTAGIFLFMRDQMHRCVREAIIFIPRKFAKTTYLSALAINDFLFGDANGEVHIVANSIEQAKIAYREAKALAMQLDPDGKQIRFTSDTFNWKANQDKQSSVQAHTAGGKTKDGAFASLVLADEYGSAQYVKDHSDMADALNVYESSMGPRLNPLTVITTTAGRVIEGPFEQKLRSAQATLYKELDLPMHGTSESDWQFLLAMHPDAWEYTDEYYAMQRVQLKVNPHIGITVQPEYYQEQWRKAQGDPEVYKETVTKLFNQFISNSSRPWIQAEDIRRLQCPHTIRDLSKDWLCFCACDFSKGDDLCSISYCCYNPSSKQYFWDCDAWIASEQLSRNSNATLYRQWIADGWLHVSDSPVINEGDVLACLDEVSSHVRLVAIGYDPYDSMRYVNLFQTWLVSRLKDAGHSARRIEELLKTILQPVSQTWASFNASCQTVWDLVKSPTQQVYCSPTPLLPYAFSNAVLQEDKMTNVKPVKRTPNAKIDPAICILMSIIMMSRIKR